MLLTTSMLLSLGPILFPDVPDGEGGGPPPLAVLRRCTIEYANTTDLGAAQFGIYKECLVRRGDSVEAGQVLGRLEDDDARAELALRTIEAESTITVRINEARRDQAAEKLRASEILMRRDALSLEEFNLRRLEATTAALAVEEAEYQREIAAMQRKQAEAMLRLRQFVAPHDGIVVELYKEPGEPISPNEPVIRVVDVDRVRVTGHLDVKDAWDVHPGQPVRIAPDVGGTELWVEDRWFPGELVFIDPQIDPDTQTCVIIAEVPNPGRLLRAGLEARMEILPAGAPSGEEAEQGRRSRAAE
ncbi:efflux RND transporter periplasmic adaptor subunit [Tautonia sociabilis]|uniref:Efflux RND transporter periplasmic adaptor subunit n=1 Tax=Tautonia sociabilis TaxID=2080755 RepID=A0A432MJP5_9BACT|nr:efflux RND transporter periplasmic adaptor subunit [Tautonia sociabilis]RUL87633.1 efflux RND transporter periplasmic adaptor subunit [Tautonia sociabilis]